MKLTDGTIINEPIKFLGMIRLILDKQEQVAGCYFSFNSRKMYYDDPEFAKEIRNEIIANLPEAPMIQKELDKQWEIPTETEIMAREVMARNMPNLDSSGNSY